MNTTDSPPRWMIIAGDFVATGGQDQANLALARELVRLGRRVTVVGHRFDPSLAESGGPRLIRVPRPGGKHAAGMPLLAAWGRFWADRLRPSVVVVNGGNAPGVCPGSGRSLVNWVHYVHAAAEEIAALNGSNPLLRFKRRAFLHAERVAMRRASRLVANSRSTANQLAERLAVAPERVAVIPYGGDDPRFPLASGSDRAAARAALGQELGRGLPEDVAVVLFVGALGDRRKGCDTLLNAWHELHRAPCHSDERSALLLIVGAGVKADATALMTRATERPEHNLHRLGFRRDVPDLLAAADLLVSPTRYEPFGLNVQEALARGVPVIVSRLAGVAERLPTTFADWLLDDPEDPMELARKLRAAIEHRRARRALAAELGQTLRSWTWHDCALALKDWAEQGLRPVSKLEALP